MFGKESRSEKLKRQAKEGSHVSGEALVDIFSGARPVAERLLYDDDLRDNIRTFIESARNILKELSREDPTDAIARLWDDKKIRSDVETALDAVSQGSRRVQGKKVGGGGGFGKTLLLLFGVIAFLLLNPWTGEQTRKMAGEIFEGLRSG